MHLPSLKSMACLMTGHTTKTRALAQKCCRTAENLLPSSGSTTDSTQENQYFRISEQETELRKETEAWSKRLKASNNRRNQVR